jgi:hypothetical protein
MGTLVVLQGTLTSDGTLQLDQKVNLPAGRVRVTVQPAQATPAAAEQFRERMRAIQAARQAGMQATDAAQATAAQRQAIREEMELEIQEAMRLQEACRQARQLREPAE